jgi:shikimate kinase
MKQLRNLHEQARKQARKKKERHIVLIGLSGSGKTTLGGLLAKKLDMPLADLDAIIEKRTHMPISKIFEERGEAFFRDMETAVTREVLEKPVASVVATGGGVILRPENVRVLRENGYLIFLDRPVGHIIGDLVYDGSRPLIKKADRLYEMERERRGVYLGAADATLLNAGGMAEALAGLVRISQKAVPSPSRPGVAELLPQLS